MNEALAMFQILCISTVFCLTHLLCTVPPSIIYEASAAWDVLVGWAFAFIIAGDEVVTAGLLTQGEVTISSNTRNQTYLGHGALRQVYLPIREGTPGVTSDAIKGAAYIGHPAVVMGRVVAASVHGNLPSHLERLPERHKIDAVGAS